MLISFQREELSFTFNIPENGKNETKIRREKTRRKMLFLSFFSEVRQAQALRRLILTLFAQAGEAQHNDGDDIGQHFVQFLYGGIGAGGNVHMQNVEAAKEDGGEHADIGAPDGEDNQRDGQPAAVDIT